MVKFVDVEESRYKYVELPHNGLRYTRPQHQSSSVR